MGGILCCIENQLGTVLEIYGTTENTDMASYVHTYLINLLPVLWQDYRDRKKELNRIRKGNVIGSGVLQGFCEKLSNREEKEKSPCEVIAEWNGDPALTKFFKDYNPNVKVRRSGGVWQNDTYIAGIRTGKKVEIRSGIANNNDGFGGYLAND